jgi:glutamate synthase domain-containing protein 2
MHRLIPFAIVIVLCLSSASAATLGMPWWPSIVLLALVLLGTWDLLQRKHSLYRNYPLTGHFRTIAEELRPQVRQYFIESDTDGTPFDREQRSLAYQRAKDVVDTMPFGTELRVIDVGYEWINHSIAPRSPATEPARITIGNDQCRYPYSSSVLNISAMSFGSLSAAAIRALNRGAKLGDFAHDTGEGGLSEYHLEGGGDIVWEIGTGYFGCRTDAGRFDPERFKARVGDAVVKMVELKLSQGAKPGHGGFLPGAKVSAEIARVRGIPEGVDCASPAYHQEFNSPKGLLEFIAQLRDLSGGKPTGFKLCIGHKWEFLGICKAMIATGIYPDFIVIDGKEGGTGAAPVEFSDHVGMPRRDALWFAQNALVGTGLRNKLKLGASGKIISGFDIAVAMALGADWCNSARGFMFALGCLQSLRCHTNRCPVGVATQDPWRQRALDVSDKATRVANFHRHTVSALMELVAAAGLDHPSELRPQHINRRTSSRAVATLDRAYEWLAPGQLVEDRAGPEWEHEWHLASADHFRPA